MTATSVTFLLSKDPLLEHGGDVEMFRLILGLAAEDFDVSAICYSPDAGTAVIDLDGRAVPPQPGARPVRR